MYADTRTYAASGRTLLAALVLLGTLAAGCARYSKEQERDMQAVRDAVSADPAKLNASDTRGNTPLHFAISTDRTSGSVVIHRLLSMGADVNATNEYGDTPLHRAAFHGLTDTVRLLLKNAADINRRARRGETALHYAARPEGYPETVLALIEGGADANAVDNIGMTPLHGAAMTGNVQVARVLVEKGNADVNRQTSAGYAPLHIAALSGKADFVRFLLEKGADRKIHDREGLTPEERAVRFPAMSYSKDGKSPVDTAPAVHVLRTYQAAAP